MIFKIRTKLFITALILLSALVCSCGRGTSQKYVLVVWNTSAFDPVYQQRNVQIKETFKRHGIKIHLEDEFLNMGYKDEEGMVAALSSCLDSIARCGGRPDIFLAYGDLAQRVLLSSDDSRVKETPTVAFGILCPEDPVYGKVSRENMTVIRDSITLKENLGFMETILKEGRRFITPLDWTTMWIDEYIRNEANAQMERLDTAKYFNNLMLTYDDSVLDKMEKNGKTVLYDLSLNDVNNNICLSTGELFKSTWAFFPKMSTNHVLMLKHDIITWRLENAPDYDNYFTATSGAFGVHANCIGGHFAPFEVEIEEAVQRAEKILSGTKPSDIPTSFIKRDYYANWDVFRSEYQISDFPSYINLYNTRYMDRHPSFNRWFHIGVLVFLGGGLSIIAILLTFYGLNALRLRRKIKKRSFAAIDEMNNLQFIIKNSNATLWSLEGKTLIYDGEKNSRGVFLTDMIARSNEYFRAKLHLFFANNIPGAYKIQIPRTDIDGQEHWYEIRLFIKKGIRGVEKSGITINIDDQKKMEAEIHEAHRLITLSSEREKFISTMSHEMRTPLNSIVGFSQILSNPEYECTDEELTIFEKAIEDNNTELMKIIEDMLSITHMDNANIKMKLENISLKKFFTKAISDTDAKAAKKKDIHFVFQQGPDDAYIHVDENLFKIIMGNLISNAIKFSYENSIITIGWREGRFNYVIFVVDNGIGISKPHQENIFKRFYQVDNFTQGTGLGLALAKEYTEKMGGSLKVESDLDAGATFSLRFPKVKSIKGGKA